MKVGQANYNIAVMFDGITQGDSRYYVISDNASFISKGELNTGDQNTLVDFVDWARETLPSQHTALMISDHGKLDGLAFDDSSNDHLTMMELSTAFAQITAHHGKIDILYMDVCLMGTVEGNYQVRNLIDYYIASENLVWLPVSPSYLNSISSNLSS